MAPRLRFSVRYKLAGEPHERQTVSYHEDWRALRATLAAIWKRPLEDVTILGHQWLDGRPVKLD